MKFYGSLSVNPELPAEIKDLKKLAYNLYWCWNPEAENLFQAIDGQLWEKVNKNPVKFLSKVSYKALKDTIDDREFIIRYNKVMEDLNYYLQSKDTWFNKTFDSLELDSNEVIAYFSTEFGFHESLPIYSGGLGVLSGDHCKSASDLGLPFVGVGLLYRNGYFRQKINDEGWQEAVYPKLKFDYLPVNPVKNDNGNDLLVTVKLANRVVSIKVWEVKVGRVSLYLLDTDVEVNSEEDRRLTSRLYGGDSETRISQEIILGIGGIRALVKMGYSPAVWHMNEGHSVYLGLERIRNLMREEGLDFQEAVEKVSSNTVFTTHTPVPAGNETFSFDLKDKYFSDYYNEVGLTRDEFMKLGIKDESDHNFCLTVLALKLAKFNNGVSRLHGKVSSDMWESIWEGVPAFENPISYITNGIHTLTWLAPEWKELLGKYLPRDWKERLEDKEMWEKVKDIPDKEFWEVHRKLKSKMIDFIRKRELKRQKRYNKLRDDSLDVNLLDKDTLTIGFARRFATYKRANLILKDLKRLKKICNKEGKEVQLVFAGKAHPADIPGQELIKDIYQLTKNEDFKGKIVILEDYDMNMARYLVQGVDVWLNNPRRPLEASGTSGQKVAANGGLNFSVLDGWWCEGYNGDNGWTIGYKSEYSSQEEQDLLDSNSLYKTLEKDIVELYYDEKDEEFSKKWVNRMKETMISNAPEYSTSRMVQEYTERFYVPAIKEGVSYSEDNYKKAREMKAWKDKLEANWNQVEITSVDQGELGDYNINDSINLTVEVKAGELKPEDIDVEVYLVREDNLEDVKIVPMEFDSVEEDNDNYIYSTEVKLAETGDYKYTFRVIPNADKLINKHETGLIRWI